MMKRLSVIQDPNIIEFEDRVSDEWNEILETPTNALISIKYSTCSILDPETESQLIHYIAFIEYDYLTEVQAPASSDVITPPKPAEVRQERQREEENRDVTLDAQLSNPELGNE